MGANTSSNEYGRVFIITDKDSYKAGDTINGTVYIKMDKPLPGGAVLKLKFKGWEKTRWIDELTLRSGQNIFYRNSVQLYNWPKGSVINCEDFSFPFCLKTHVTIPGTFIYVGKGDESNVYAEIRYKIKTEISPHLDDIPKIKNHTMVVIRENYDNYRENLYKETSLACNTCFCVNQGVSKLGCQFEQSTYLAGDTADLIVAVDNSGCGLAVDAIEAKFIQTISLLSSGGAVRNIQKTLLKKDFGKVDPYLKKVGKDANKIALKLAGEKPFEPSTSGDIITCKYDLMVKCQMAGPCMQAEPKVKANVFLYPTPLQDFGKLQAPQGFAPRLMPQYAFALSSENQYANKDGSQAVLTMRAPGHVGMQPLMPPPVHQNQVMPVIMMQTPPMNQIPIPGPLENQPLMQNQMNQPPQMMNEQPQINSQPQINQQPQMMNQQPQMMNQESQIVNQQPQMNNNQQPQVPIMNHQPQLMNQQVPMMNQQPQMANQQPQTMNQQPLMIKQQPQMMNQQPQIMNQQPQMMNQQPQIMNQYSQMMNQQPQMVNQQPQMMNQQPQFMNQQPQMMNQQTQIMNQQHQMMNHQPQMMNQKPQIMYQQPQMINLQPQMMNQIPQMMNQQVPMMNQQMPMMNQQPMMMNQQPVPQMIYNTK